MQRTFVLAACLGCLSFLSGCSVPYCVYPTLDSTPTVKLDSPSSEVYAFRVDSTLSKADKDPGEVYESLSRVPVTNTAEVPGQLKPSASYGCVVLGIGVGYLTHTSHSVAVRVYRPGYELVEIKSWEQVQRVVWKPAADLEAQEKALAGLFPHTLEKLPSLTERLEARDTHLPLTQLAAGSTSPAHKEALLFGAKEYERLAAYTQEPAHKAQLTGVADKLRDLARE